MTLNEKVLKREAEKVQKEWKWFKKKNKKAQVLIK